MGRTVSGSENKFTVVSLPISAYATTTVGTKLVLTPRLIGALTLYGNGRIAKIEQLLVTLAIASVWDHKMPMVTFATRNQVTNDSGNVAGSRVSENFHTHGNYGYSGNLAIISQARPRKIYDSQSSYSLQSHSQHYREIPYTFSYDTIGNFADPGNLMVVENLPPPLLEKFSVKVSEQATFPTFGNLAESQKMADLPKSDNFVGYSTTFNGVTNLVTLPRLIELLTLMDSGNLAENAIVVQDDTGEIVISVNNFGYSGDLMVVQHVAPPKHLRKIYRKCRSQLRENLPQADHKLGPTWSEFSLGNLVGSPVSENFHTRGNYGYSGNLANGIITKLNQLNLVIKADSGLESVLHSILKLPSYVEYIESQSWQSMYFSDSGDLANGDMKKRTDAEIHTPLNAAVVKSTELVSDEIGGSGDLAKNAKPTPYHEARLGMVEEGLRYQRLPPLSNLQATGCGLWNFSCPGNLAKNHRIVGKAKATKVGKSKGLPTIPLVGLPRITEHPHVQIVEQRGVVFNNSNGDLSHNSRPAYTCLADNPWDLANNSKARVDDNFGVKVAMDLPQNLSTHQLRRVEKIRHNISYGVVTEWLTLLNVKTKIGRVQIPTPCHSCQGQEIPTPCKGEWGRKFVPNGKIAIWDKSTAPRRADMITTFSRIGKSCNGLVPPCHRVGGTNLVPPATFDRGTNFDVFGKFAKIIKVDTYTIANVGASLHTPSRLVRYAICIPRHVGDGMYFCARVRFGACTKSLKTLAMVFLGIVANGKATKVSHNGLWLTPSRVVLATMIVGKGKAGNATDNQLSVAIPRMGLPIMIVKFSRIGKTHNDDSDDNATMGKTVKTWGNDGNHTRANIVKSSPRSAVMDFPTFSNLANWKLPPSLALAWWYFTTPGKRSEGGNCCSPYEWMIKNFQFLRNNSKARVIHNSCQNSGHLNVAGETPRHLGGNNNGKNCGGYSARLPKLPMSSRLTWVSLPKDFVTFRHLAETHKPCATLPSLAWRGNLLRYLLVASVARSIFHFSDFGKLEDGLGKNGQMHEIPNAEVTQDCNHECGKGYARSYKLLLAYSHRAVPGLCDTRI